LCKNAFTSSIDCLVAMVIHIQYVWSEICVYVGVYTHIIHNVETMVGKNEF
jgi:hypothetical protein